MRRTLSRTELWVVGAAAFLALVVLPCLNVFAPPGSALHVETFTLSVFGKYLTYAVLALGVNLLWGYTGLLSLGQCLFFALGGYAFGMYLMLLIGHLGQYRTALPDFMVFLEFPARYPETGGLPPHWTPFQNLGFALAAVVMVPAIVAYLFGVLAFRSRIKGVYFSILSQALTYAACLMFFRNDFTFGGNNGLTDFKFMFGTPALTQADVRDPVAVRNKLEKGSDALSRHLWQQFPAAAQEKLRDPATDAANLQMVLAEELNKAMAAQPFYEAERFAGLSVPSELLARARENTRDAAMMQVNRELLDRAFPAEIAAARFTGCIVNSPSTRRALYLCSALLLLLTYVFCRWLTSTKFGLIQRAIRDSENRVLFSGYATANFKLFAFVTAAILSGLGGALYVPQVGIINPSEMSPEKSLEAVVWVAVGGRGSLLGPILGALGINALKSYATHAWAEQWPYILGALFIVVTVFMPKGLVGIPSQLRELRRRFKARGQGSDAPPPVAKRIERETAATTK